jgi:hypothetical protein
LLDVAAAAAELVAEPEDDTVLDELTLVAALFVQVQLDGAV